MQPEHHWLGLLFCAPAILFIECRSNFGRPFFPMLNYEPRGDFRRRLRIIKSMKIKQLDHVALHVADLDASRAFYAGVLQLSELPRPAFDFPGAWFALGTHELHLLGNREQEVNSHHRGTHFAVQVVDTDSVVQLLESSSIEFIRKVRPDGAKQIFVQDPDGHYVEFCQPPAVD